MQLQILFDEISVAQQERRAYEENYKLALKGNDQYQTLLADMQELKTKKVAIEEKLKNELGSVMDKLDDTKNFIKGHKDMLSDVAIGVLMDGKTVEVADKHGNVYEPRWSVKFVKKQPGTYDKESKTFEK